MALKKITKRRDADMALVCKSGGKECVGCGECVSQNEDEFFGSCPVCGRLLKDEDGFSDKYFHFLCCAYHVGISVIGEGKSADTEKKGKRTNGENRIYRY